MNKDIKRIKKLYQAAVCWGDPNNFHTKCYNIPNSLTVIKTENNRRFGRFTSSTWETNNTGEFKKDKKAFIFSLDNKKIYDVKDYNHSIYNYKKYWPCFGIGYDFSIGGNIIKENKLPIFQSSYYYNGEENCLIGVYKNNNNKFKAIDFEVFEIIFNDTEE